MKLLLENWRGYMNEAKEKIYSFDFDSTLIKYIPNPDDDSDLIYGGPHEENIQLVKGLVAQGNKVIIVTSRTHPDKLKTDIKWPNQPDIPGPEELVNKGAPIYKKSSLGEYEVVGRLSVPIKPEDIHYTNGNFKAETLKSLNVSEHWDDDEEEIQEIRRLLPNVKAHLVPTPEGVTEGLYSKWVKSLKESGVEVTPKVKKYLDSHPYMEPNALQDA